MFSKNKSFFQKFSKHIKQKILQFPNKGYCVNKMPKLEEKECILWVRGVYRLTNVNPLIEKIRKYTSLLGYDLNTYEIKVLESFEDYLKNAGFNVVNADMERFTEEELREELKMKETMDLVKNKTSLNQMEMEKMIDIDDVLEEDKFLDFQVHKEDPKLLEERKKITLKCIPKFKYGGIYVICDRFYSKQVKDFISQHDFLGSKRKVVRVEGVPFIEDIASEIPFKQLRVSNFQMSREELFTVFRKFGRIDSLQTNIEPKDPKGAADIRYLKLENAILAKICLHKKIFDGVPISIEFSPAPNLWEIIKKLLQNPRFTVIVAAVLISISSLLLVDPFRLINVTKQITVRNTGQSSEHKIWDDHGIDYSIHELENLLKEEPAQLIILTGSDYTKQVSLGSITNDRYFVVKVDCKGIKTEEEFIDRLVYSVGFSPSFQTLSNFVSYFESFLPKMHNAFTKSTEAQFQLITETVTRSLRLISNRNLGTTTEILYPIFIFDGIDDLYYTLKSKELLELILNWSNLISDMNLSHVVICSENNLPLKLTKNFPKIKDNLRYIRVRDLSHEQTTQYLMSFLQPNDLKGMVFEPAPSLHKSGDKDSGIVNWFVKVSVGRILSTISSFSNKQDAKPEGVPPLVGENILVKVPYKPSLLESDSKDILLISQLLGGRLNEILSFSKRYVSAKDSPSFHEKSPHPLSVVEAMIEDQKIYVLKEGFGMDLFGESEEREWNQLQLWNIIKTLAEKEEIEFSNLVLDFLGGNGKAMEALFYKKFLRLEETLPVHSDDGKYKAFVRASSPIMLQSFRSLVNNRAFFKSMEQFRIGKEISGCVEEIGRCEKELVDLQNGGVQNIERKQKLVAKIEELTKEIQKKEFESSQL